MLFLRTSLGAALALLASAASGCDDLPAVVVRYAPEFTPSRAPVAVFGVFQGGRMSASAWQPLSAKLSAALGRAACPVAFGEALQHADLDLYTSIDEDVAENGVTDELLAKLAPKTDAELLVTFSVHGRVEQARTPAVGDDPTLPGHRPGASGGARGHRRSGKALTFAGIEMSASLFSVKLHRSVGRITVRYAGTSVDEAATAFAAKVGEELAGSTCRDWRFTPPS